MLSTRAKAVSALVFAVLLIAPATAGAVKVSPGQISCNGSSRLCERKLNEVVLPGSHNSMSASELNWNLPNQTFSIPNQLKRGARAMLIDTYYGEPQPNGQVVIVGKAQGHAEGAPLYLCHQFCQLGSSELIPELVKIADFLHANPNEVLAFINQDAIHPDDFATAVEQAGLLEFIYTGPAGPWPTLGEMVASGQRVLMLAESDAGTVSWYHEAYDGVVRETPYTFTDDTALLTDPGQLNESCRSLRGEGTATQESLFLMNHWISESNFQPNIQKAETVNREQVLVERARACEQRRGFLPNILAVDFFGTGDVTGAARQLNGVESKARLGSPRIRKASARAGRAARLSVPVTNSGDMEASSVRVCVTPPRRLARKPGCSGVGQMLAGSKATFRFRLATKKKAKGKGKIRIRVRSSVGSYTAKARLKVEARQRKRRG